MRATPPLRRDPSRGYCLGAFLPFIVSPAVLALRGASVGVVLIAGPLAGFAGILIGALFAFAILEASGTVRKALGDMAIPVAGTIAALLIALLAPLP